MELSRFCDTPFWDVNRTWYTDDPDFTQCFKDTALIWIPSLYLWILSPLEFYFFKKSITQDIPLNLYNCSKLVGIIIITLLSIINMFDNAVENSSFITYQKSSIQFITYALFFSLTWANMKMGIRSSGILFGFSFLLVFCGFPEFRSTVKNGIKDNTHAQTHFFAQITHWVASVVILILNCFADDKPKYTLYSNEHICPDTEASFLSKLYLCWFNKFIWKSYKNPVSKNLWDLNNKYTAAYNSPKFEKFWSQSRPKTTRYEEYKEDYKLKKFNLHPKCEPKSIIRPLIKMFYLPFLEGMFWRFIDTLMNLSFPIIFSCLIGAIECNDPSWKLYMFVSFFMLNNMIQTVVLTKFFCGIVRIQMRIKSAIMSAIYKKILKLSSLARRQYPTGDIVNLLLIDVNRIVIIVYYLNNIWIIPLQILLTFYFVGRILGLSVLPGFGIVIALIPINYFIAKYKKKVQLLEMLHRDKCMKFIQDLLSGIKVLKMYAWEPSFEKEASRLRNSEVKLLKVYGYLHGILQFICACVPIMISTAVFATYVISSEDNILSIQKAFVTISFLNTLRIPLETVPSLLSNIMQAVVSVNRVNEFLSLEDLDPRTITHDDTTGISIIVENAEFSWNDDEGLSTLRNINLKIEDGELVSVIGSVGAGKSSLISALLGEIQKISGKVNTKGTVAYVPQQAWILNASVKNNITLGESLDEMLYQKALSACALTADLANMPNGDLTEIGEKGVNLSGGQKQRISLARAVCFNADIYLMDDPLSAVDFNVAKHIFENVLGPNGLLQHKTRIIVTHNISFLSQSNLIVLLENGLITKSGTYNELQDENGYFAEFLKTYSNDNMITESNEGITKKDEGNKADRRRASSSELDTTDEAVKDAGEASHLKLIEKEHLETGTVKYSVYLFYLSALGFSLAFTIILIFIIHQCFAVSANVWMSIWSMNNQKSKTADNDRFFYLSIYAALGLGEAISSLLRNVTLFIGIVRASTVLYNKLLTSVLQWPMRIFDSTPFGRITNRFTVDIYSLDYEIGPKMVSILALVKRFIVVFIVIIYTTPICTFIIVPVLIAKFIVQKVYVKLSLQLKRIDLINKSPLSSHFLETLSGLQSIRAYKLQEKFIAQSYEKIDLHSASQYAMIVCSRWLSIRIDILGGIVVFFATFFMVQQRDILHSGLIAFATSYALQITKELSWLLYYMVDVQNAIISAERVKEFVEYPQEPKSDVPSSVPDEWPEKGKIVFEDYSLKYREGLNLVLKGLNFTVRMGEKIGIVGRTGAGKSSMISALFGITEPVSGKILIDDIDIACIDLHVLRSRLTVIPQDPVLFLGSLRFNLDPTGKYSDENVWNALEKAYLKQYVTNLPDGLYYNIEEGGGNLSFGQRQLICLARALLRKTKILILDEATASVDLETDKLIQETICKEFADCTVLTIAHRLNTIQNYDRIMVLDKGTIVEFDTPDVLFKSKNSIFQRMTSEAGLI